MAEKILNVPQIGAVAEQVSAAKRAIRDWPVKLGGANDERVMTCILDF